MNGRIITALDIGTTKIAALAARQNEYGKVEILGIGVAQSLGVKRGVVANIDKTVDAITRAVAQAEERSGIEFKKVIVGIAGQHIKSLQHRGIRVRDQHELEISRYDIERLIEDMHKLALPPGDKIIHVIPQDFIVDSESGITEPIGMAGIRLEGNFHIITGQTGAIQNITRCVTRAGMEVEGLVLEPLASAAAVLSKDELEAGVALVDIGGGTTDLAVFEAGIIRHTAVIPLGGDIITEDIRKGCQILRDQAESLKIRFGSAMSIESQNGEVVAIPGLKGKDPKEISVYNLSSIIEARMEEILAYVHHELRSADFDGKLIGGIVLTGGGSQLKHIVQLTQYITGMDARLGIPNEHLASKNIPEADNPIYATGIGLAVRAFEEPGYGREETAEESELRPRRESAPEAQPVGGDMSAPEVELPVGLDSDDDREEEGKGVDKVGKKGRFTGILNGIVINIKQFFESDMEDFDMRR